jgi:hypothetical protein
MFAWGCTIKRQNVAVQDISGPLFTKEIGCSIYFIWSPPQGQRGVKRFINPLRELYCINPRGELKRLYVPRPNTAPRDYVLTDYGYPIFIQENWQRLAVLASPGVRREFTGFDDYVDLIGVSRDDGRVLISLDRSNESGEADSIIASLDVETREIVSETVLPSVSYGLSFKGYDAGLRNILIFKRESEGSYSKESITWWEPYVYSMTGDSSFACEPLDFPGEGRHGIHEIDIVREDGRIVGFAKGGDSTNYYQSYPPYNDFELVAKMDGEPPAIHSLSRDGSCLLLSWESDGGSMHFYIWEPATGKMDEIFVASKQMRYNWAFISPDGERFVIIINHRWESKDNRKQVISIYDADSGELIESIEWPFGGNMFRFKVGY